MFRWEGERGSCDKNIRFDSCWAEGMLARSSSRNLFLLELFVWLVCCVLVDQVLDGRFDFGAYSNSQVLKRALCR